MNKMIHLSLGYTCNNDCVYCLNHNTIKSLKFKGESRLDRTAKEIKTLMDKVKKDGADSLVLTGGEATIRPDFFKILSYAVQRFDDVGIQTNGRMFSDIEFTKKVMDIAPNATFVLHIDTVDSQVGDKITKVKNSTQQTIEGLNNLLKVGAYVDAVIILSKFNYQLLPHTVERLAKEGIKEFSIQYVMPIKDETGQHFMPLWSKVESFIKNAIVIADRHKAKIMFSETPLCYLKGYENHSSELDYLFNNVKQKEKLRADGDVVYFKEGMQKEKAKPTKCMSCIYFYLCEGVWKQYLQEYKTDEFIPIKGNPITNLKELKNIFNNK